MEKPTKPFRYVKSDRVVADARDHIICEFNSEAVTGYEESICAKLIITALNRNDRAVIDEFLAAVRERAEVKNKHIAPFVYEFLMTDLMREAIDEVYAERYGGEK